MNSRITFHAMRQILALGLVLLLTALANVRGQTNCIPCDRASTAGLLSETTGQSGDFAVRRAGAEVNARWKIPVSQDGLYRLTYDQMVAAGISSNELIGSQIRLYCRTQEVAILVTSSSQLTSQDAVYFYGVKHDGAYNRTNVYWLGFGGTGRRMAVTSGSPVGGETLVTSACFSAVYDAKNLHRPYHQPFNTQIDHWFAELVTTSTPVSISLNTSNRVPGEVANLSIAMFGLTEDTSVNPDHRTRIRVNGSVIAQPTFEDTVLMTTNYFINGTNLLAGMTTADLLQNQVGVSNDFAYLIRLRIDFVATNQMRSTHHEFCGRAGTNVYRVSGVVTNGGLWLLNLADIYAPELIVNARITNSTTVEFRCVTNGVTRFAVVQSNGLRTAASPQQVTFRNLGDASRSADYLLICPVELRQQAYRLAKQRYTNGLNIAVAPLNDVYNEFGYGVVDVYPIKQFIGYAYHHWSTPKPRFAVLVGEGTYDPLGYLGSVPAINLPTRFGPSPQVVAAMDTWYGLVDGTTNAADDLLPDVVIGRIAVSTLGQLSNVVNKITVFDSSISSNALLVSDYPDGTNNFYGSSQTNIHSILSSNGYNNFQFAGPPLNPSQSRSIITNNFGRRIVSFVGHGAVDRWSSANLLNTNDAVNLGNTTYPVVTIFSCNNGSFVDRQTNCLSEVLLESTRGAASVFTPTALSAQQFSDKLAAGFMTSWAAQKRRYLGDIAFEAYLNLWSFNPNVSELRTYQIIGDPGLLANRPGTLP